MKLRTFIVAMAVLVMGAGAATASNMASLVRHQLTFDSSGNNLYWISIPYHYQPPDANGNGVVDAEDLAQDLQPRGAGYTRPCDAGSNRCAVYQVRKWDESAQAYVTWRSGSTLGTPFQLTPGESYGIDLQAVGSNTTHVLEVAGSNDPGFQLQYCFDPNGVNYHRFSLPANLKLDDVNGNGQMDAEDLGQAMGGPDWIYQIRRYNTSTGEEEVWRVGTAFGTPFPIDPAQGYVVDLVCPNTSGGCTSANDPCAWSWTPPHY